LVVRGRDQHAICRSEHQQGAVQTFLEGRTRKRVISHTCMVDFSPFMRQRRRRDEPLDVAAVGDGVLARHAVGPNIENANGTSTWPRAANAAVGAGPTGDA
jgi:hypothetical protein